MLNDEQMQQLYALNTVLNTLSPDKLLQLIEQDQVIDVLSGAHRAGTSFLLEMYNRLALANMEVMALRNEVTTLKSDVSILVKSIRSMQNGVSQSYGDMTPLCSKHGYY
jgi:hypothetical protein